MNIVLKISITDEKISRTAKRCLQAEDICLASSFSLCDVAPELEMRMSCFSEIDQVDDL